MLMGSVSGWTMARRTWFGWCEDSARTKGLSNFIASVVMEEEFERWVVLCWSIWFTETVILTIDSLSAPKK
ncbi:hypothetical protein WN944_026820 [Citrus x changshan-huyou]|uniref:Uncharacterized protein n=1 Tax=Citrus x changshan-huyou TaxID=2935761 RepID=A0AAP0QCD2_9ROSI